MSFDSLGLRAELLRAVHEQEYTTPTPVQAQAIPAILAGRDLMAAAQTGTGKTAGFTLPMLQRLLDSEPAEPLARRPVRALILVPTRELCAQVAESVRTYGKHVPLRCAQIFGGVGMQPQVDALRRGVDIVIATPGRLLDHVQRRSIDLSKVEILVLDEADRMLDMGFIAPIKRILSLLPAQRQNLLFSATFADDIRKLADRLMNSPEMIDVTPPNKPVEAIEQLVYHVDAAQKPDALAHLFLEKGWVQALVFTRTKHGADRLAKRLVKAGITADAIHGNKSQNARTRALATFKEGKVCALVATDIAARGLDIDGLPQVVNFELPHVPEDYVHRIGRTGRAGAVGHAISLVSRDEIRQLRAIERVIGRTLPSEVVPGFEPMHGVPAPAREGAPRGQASPRGRPQGQAQRRGDGAPNGAPNGAPDGAQPPFRGEGRGDGVPRDGRRNSGPRRDSGIGREGQRGPMPPRDAPEGGFQPPGYSPQSSSPYRGPMRDNNVPAYRETMNADGVLDDDSELIDEEEDARGNREPLPQASQQQRQGARGGRSDGRPGGGAPRGGRPGGPGRDRRPGGDQPYAPPGVMVTRSGDTQGGWGGAARPAAPRGQGQGQGRGYGAANSNNSGRPAGSRPPGARPNGPRSGGRNSGGSPRPSSEADSGFSRKRYGYPEERGARAINVEPRRYASSSEIGRGGAPRPNTPPITIIQRGARLGGAGRRTTTAAPSNDSDTSSRTNDDSNNDE